MVDGVGKLKNLEQRKQELLSRLEQIQRENPGCLWLQVALYMNNPTDSEASCDSKKQGTIMSH